MSFIFTMERRKRDSFPQVNIATETYKVERIYMSNKNNVVYVCDYLELSKI